MCPRVAYLVDVGTMLLRLEEGENIASGGDGADNPRGQEGLGRDLVVF